MRSAPTPANKASRTSARIIAGFRSIRVTSSQRLVVARDDTAHTCPGTGSGKSLDRPLPLTEGYVPRETASDDSGHRLRAPGDGRTADSSPAARAGSVPEGDRRP